MICVSLLLFFELVKWFSNNLVGCEIHLRNWEIWKVQMCLQHAIGSHQHAVGSHQHARGSHQHAMGSHQHAMGSHQYAMGSKLNHVLKCNSLTETFQISRYCIKRFLMKESTIAPSKFLKMIKSFTVSRKQNSRSLYL